MRPIKFRAWDKQEKEMGKVMYLNLSEYSTDHILKTKSHPNFYNQTSENVVFMQFTGLLDKNGIEIFEGDIVKLIIQHQSIVNNSSLEIEISQVEFSPSYFRLRGSILGAGSLISENIEIIGNIYETPELLKGEK